MEKEDIKFVFIGLLIGFIMLVIAGGTLALFGGWAYEDICKEQGINNIIKCGIVAPNFGQEVFIDYQK